jgi:hypothetical protein
MLEVLHRHGTEYRIEASALQREMLFSVQILEKKVVQVLVGPQFIRVQAVANDIAQFHLRWQMRHPTAHQVENVVAGTQPFTVHVGETLAEGLVHMLNKAGLAVERVVGPRILLLALGVG